MSRITGLFDRSALGRSLWAFRREFVWVGIFSLFVNVLLLTPTVYMLQIYDRIMLSGNLFTLAVVSLIAVALFAIMGFAEWLRSRLLVRASARFDDALGSRVFDATFDASLAGATRNPTQPLNDLATLRQFLAGSGAFAFFDTPWASVYVAVLFLMNAWLGWTAVAFMVIMLALAVVSHRLSAPRYAKAQDDGMAASAFLYAKLRNVETLAALGMLGALRRIWFGLHERQLAAQEDAKDFAHRLQALTKFVQYTQQAIVLAVGALLAIDGQISAGAMIAANALVANAVRPVGTLVSTWRLLVEARRAYGRLEALLDEHPPRDDRHHGASVQAQITLKGLVARAPGRDKPILQGLDAEFRPGEVVAIVGPSGAGKSTLARCLVGIWPGAQDGVWLDGEPIGAWSRQALGPHLGYLPQDIELFDGTIAENIARFGELDSQRIIEAAQRCGIHEMVLRFPRGYDTPIGEAGGLLSGGQRQRIGLARAIYGAPRLVVLDEPNASLDDIGEAALVRTVRELRDGGSTVFMVVHQRNILAAADRVLLLRDGRIEALAAVTPSPRTTTPQPLEAHA